MDFQQATVQIQDTLIVMAEIQRRQAEVQEMQAEGIALHEARMNHVDMRFAEITGKLDESIGLDGQFGKH